MPWIKMHNMIKMNNPLLFLALMVFTACKPGAGEVLITEEENGTWSLIVGQAKLLIDPADGAKDISLQIGEREFLTSKEVRKEYYGNSLWLAPQQQYWPEPKVLDFGPYTVEKSGNGVICTSQPDEENGLQYTKSILANADKQAFIHRYSIINISDTIKQLAAWEVTRFPKQGLSFFPYGDSLAPGTRYLDPSIPMLRRDGMIWHHYDPSQKGHPGKGSKAIMDGKNGWIAYLLNYHVFVKVFPDIAPEKMIPGELDVEIYVDNQYDYIEIEVLSENTRLAAGETLDWEVEWRILEIPSPIDLSAGNLELVNFIRSEIGL